jgi:hypothetical protein
MFSRIGRSLLKDLEREAEDSSDEGVKAAAKAKAVALSRASGVVCSWTSLVRAWGECRAYPFSRLSTKRVLHKDSASGRRVWSRRGCSF